MSELFTKSTEQSTKKSELSTETTEHSTKQSIEWVAVNTLFRSSSCQNPRYEVGRTKFYKKWLKWAKVTPYKRRNKTFINKEQLARLDEFNEWITKGLNPKEFNPATWLGEEQEGGALAVSASVEIEQKPKRLRPKDKAEREAISDVDLNMVPIKAATLAEEEIIVKLLARKLIDNPELIPQEAWERIEQVTAALESRIPPKPKLTPEEFAAQLLPGLGLPD